MGKVTHRRICKVCSKEFELQKPSSTKFLCGKSCATTYRNKTRANHRRSGSSEYKLWAAMISRCESKKNKDYKNYGGRGIKVCTQWMNSFELFYNDMYPRPSLKHSIDRINNNGNYEPSNCRWATIKQQANNRRLNIKINYNGQRFESLSELASYLNIARDTLALRIKRGWSMDRIFQTKEAVKGFI